MSGRLRWVCATFRIEGRGAIGQEGPNRGGSVKACGFRFSLFVLLATNEQHPNNQRGIPPSVEIRRAALGSMQAAAVRHVSEVISYARFLEERER